LLKMSKVPLHALPGFIATARLGNLSRAAASLHLTVSALSHQMRGLELQLRKKLFDRRARGLALTEAGERLFAAVAPHYDILEVALRPDRERSGQSLAVSVMPSVASSWLLPRLAGFVSAHPEIDLSVHSSVELVDFDREAIDAAMRFGPGTWPGVRADPLFDEWLLPVASPALLARFSDRDPDDLAELPLLRDPSDRWRDWFARFGGAPPRRYVASFSDTETLQRAAVEGMGVALGRMTMAQPMIDHGRLVALSSRRMRADFSHYLVYPLRSEQHPALRVFRAWLLEEAAAYARTTPGPTSAAAVSARPRASRARRSRRGQTR
jgi:LysR family transcriptional regulator, glycine cleavage system transcriptional activator